MTDDTKHDSRPPHKPISRQSTGKPLSPAAQAFAEETAARVADALDVHATETAEALDARAERAAERLEDTADRVANELRHTPAGGIPIAHRKDTPAPRPVDITPQTRFSWPIVVVFVALATGAATTGLIARAAAQDAGNALVKLETKAAADTVAAQDARLRALELAHAVSQAKNDADHDAMKRDLAEIKDAVKDVAKALKK